MKFDVLVLDPPWEWKARSPKGEGKSAKRHYPVMKLKDIQALPIKELGTPDCAIFLWATGSLLHHAFATLAAWGFEYVTMPFVWAKLTKCAYANFAKWQKQGKTPEEILARLFHNGTGYWTMANAEVVLMGRLPEGHPKRVKKDIRSLIVTPVQEHSQKPQEFRRRVDRMMGAVPKIEVFAREPADGWVSIGNEIDGCDIQESIRRVLAISSNSKQT